MARYAGLEAGYQEVSTQPNWNREKGIIFVSKHISAYATVNAPHDSTVDLLFYPDGKVMIKNSSYQSFSLPPQYKNETAGGRNQTTITPVPDNRAFAQYYNNLAAMHLAEADTPEAYRYFAKALRVEPGLDFIWSNLGVAYSRDHRLDAAEEAFLRAFSIAKGSGDITILSIMNNMSKLYERRGDEKKAAFYRNEVASVREKNPYYHYIVGQSAFSNADYEEAVRHYKEAIRRKADDETFYYSLAMAYLKLGNIKQAEKNLDKANCRAWDDRTKAHYAEVLEEVSPIALN
jgi:Flp pilus assembly protein TadD